MNQVVLKTEDLCKNYQVGPQVVRALRDVNTEVRAGEFVAVMGPSGSGKSTFMNLLGCLDTPSSGRYTLEGKEVSDLSNQERAHIRNLSIGFVFQSFNLLPRTSALDNVALPLRYSHTPRRERHARAMEVLEAVGLAERAGHHPSQLSGGQQQRVAIARAMVNDPAIVMADEPTGALDTRTGTEVMALFQALNRRGMTVVLVTHESDIARFAGRLLQFRDGLLTSDQPVAEISDAKQVLSTMPQARNGQ